MHKVSDMDTTTETLLIAAAHEADETLSFERSDLKLEGDLTHDDLTHLLDLACDSRYLKRENGNSETHFLFDAEGCLTYKALRDSIEPDNYLAVLQALSNGPIEGSAASLLLDGIPYPYVSGVLLALSLGDEGFSQVELDESSTEYRNLRRGQIRELCRSDED